MEQSAYCKIPRLSSSYILSLMQINNDDNLSKFAFSKTFVLGFDTRLMEGSCFVCCNIDSGLTLSIYFEFNLYFNFCKQQWLKFPPYTNILGFVLKVGLDKLI